MFTENFNAVTPIIKCTKQCKVCMLIACWGGLAQWLASRTTDQGVPGSRPGRGTVSCGLEQVTITHCLVLVKPVDGRLTRTNCDEAGDYVVPNVLSPKDLVSRPDNMDETVLSSIACLKLSS